MRCIFCKANSDGCVSVEHIVPESLGNTEHLLPMGWVCDTCNNYFAREVEKPFLDSLYGRSSRFEMGVPNKRGRIPPVTGLHPQSRTKIKLFHSLDDGSLSVAAADGEDASRWISFIQSHSHGTLYVPTAFAPDADTTTARFIGKVALEILALRCIDVSGANDEIVDKPELEELRRYVRFGQPKSVWPVRMRRIYPADFVFPDAAYGSHEVLHEWTILCVPDSEYYAIIAIFGIEYAINLGGPELEGYDRWLKDNGNRSPLFDTSSA
jgi:hypothetical protein